MQRAQLERTDEYFNGPKGIYTDVELTKPDIIKDDQSVGHVNR